MKVRIGFVSNSSSSSFMVAYREDGLEKFNLPISHPLFNLINIKKTILNCISIKYKTIEEYLDDYKKNIDECDPKHIQWLKEGYTIGVGSFSDESSDNLERFLCEVAIDFDDVNLKLCKDGGY